MAEREIEVRIGTSGLTEAQVDEAQRKIAEAVSNETVETLSSERAAAGTSEIRAEKEIKENPEVVIKAPLPKEKQISPL